MATRDQRASRRAGFEAAPVSGEPQRQLRGRQILRPVDTNVRRTSTHHDEEGSSHSSDHDDGFAPDHANSDEESASLFTSLRAGSSGAVSNAPSTAVEGRIDDETAEYLDVDVMEAGLADLDKHANSMLDIMLSANGKSDFQWRHAGGDNRARKRFEYHWDNFQRSKTHYTARDGYIQPRIVLRKLCNGRPEKVTRPDLIAHKANLVQLLIDLLSDEDTPDLTTLEYVENDFTRTATGCDFSRETFDLALALTTQVVLARLYNDRDNYSIDHLSSIASDSFIVVETDDSEEVYRHWATLGAGRRPDSEQRDLQDQITERIEVLSAPFSQRRSPASIIGGLCVSFPWDKFTELLLKFCRHRRTALDKQITQLGGPVAMQDAIRLQLEGRALRVETPQDQQVSGPSTMRSSMDYNNAGANFMRRLQKRPLPVAARQPLPLVEQNEPNDVEEEDEDEDEADFEQEPSNRQFGKLGPTNRSQSGTKRPHDMISSDTPPSIQPTQDASTQPAYRQSARRPAQSPSVQPSNTWSARRSIAEASPLVSLNAAQREAVNEMELPVPSTNLFYRKKPRPFNMEEENRITLIVDALKDIGVSPAAIKTFDANIGTVYRHLEPVLQSRKVADIKDKLKLMKRKMVIRLNGSVDPGWEGIYLPSQEIDRIRGAGVCYDRDEERKRYAPILKRQKDEATARKEEQLRNQAQQRP